MELGSLELDYSFLLSKKLRPRTDTLIDILLKVTLRPHFRNDSMNKIAEQLKIIKISLQSENMLMILFHIVCSLLILIFDSSSMSSVVCLDSEPKLVIF